MQVSRNPEELRSVDREQVDMGLKAINDSGGVFGVRKQGTFIPIHKDGEKLRKEGLRLHIIKPDYSRIPASVHMQNLLNITGKKGIRWINHLYFKMPGDIDAKSVKYYIEQEYSCRFTS
jgi:hypothetical protein